jgi:hypothetical protein
MNPAGQPNKRLYQTAMCLSVQPLVSSDRWGQAEPSAADFEVPTPFAASSITNFKSKSGTRKQGTRGP